MRVRSHEGKALYRGRVFRFSNQHIQMRSNTQMHSFSSALNSVFMVALFIVELISFMSHRTETMVVLDHSHDQLVRAHTSPLEPCLSPVLVATCITKHEVGLVDI